MANARALYGQFVTLIWLVGIPALAIAGNPQPTTVEEAAARLLKELDDESIQTLLRTPSDDLVGFHFSWGMGIRNSFGLWRGNKELLNSCASYSGRAESAHPDECSGVIIKEVWSRVRDSANPLLVAALDHQFALLPRVSVPYEKLNGRPTQDVIQELNERIRETVGPSEYLSVQARGKYDPLRPIRISRVGSDQIVSLDRLFPWLEGKNSFRVVHEPPTIYWVFE